MSDNQDDDLETVREGFFRYRAAKGAPWQALRIMRESGAWVALLSGQIVPGSCAARARDVPFLLWRSPFHPVSEAEYAALLAAYQDAPVGHPLRSPNEAVDWRAAPAGYERKAR